MKIINVVLTVFLFYYVSPVIAQQKVKLPDGRIIQLNTDGMWKFSEVPQQNLKLLDGRIVTIYPDGRWQHKELTKDQFEIGTADGTKVLILKNGKWKVKPVPPAYSTMTDGRDGKTYRTVKIGSQWWMAENIGFKTESGSWAFEDDESYVPEYGRLYDWYTAVNVCPVGWHLPTNEEWRKLEDYLLDTGNGYIVPQLIEIGTKNWRAAKNSADTIVNNASGFSALPGGIRYHKESEYMYPFNNGQFTYWWSSTQYAGVPVAISRGFWKFHVPYGRMEENYVYMSYGLSVRCIKD